MSIAVSQVRSRGQQVASEGSDTTYTVQRGDTLARIARHLDVSLAALKRANPEILNPNVIYPDQRINVPANAEACGSSRSEGQVRATASVTGTDAAYIPDAIGGDGVTAAQLRRIVPV